MKRIDMSCASQAATAICLSMEEIMPASSSAPTIQLGGGRAIDRFNPIITDSRRRTEPVKKPPPAPKPSDIDAAPKKDNKSNKGKNKKKISREPLLFRGDKAAAGGGGGGWRCTKPGGFITPQSSSRYLLNDEKDCFLDVVSGFDPILKLDDPNNNYNNDDKLQLAEKVRSEPSSSNPPSASTDKVVVVLRVSLHCRGCEKKMRKHISRMQGVSSFNIDFLAKKVTVIGDVTPLGVLASISKVKTAQLWSPAPAPVTLSNSTFKGTKPMATSSSTRV